MEDYIKTMITHFRIKNFKSIKEADLDLNRVNLLIGANNAGKSNLLEALEYYSRSLIVPLNELFGPGPFSYPNIFHKGSNINKEGIEIDVSFSGNNDTSHKFRIDSLRNSGKSPGFHLKVINESIDSSSDHFQKENEDKLLFREKGIKKELPHDLVEMFQTCRTIRKFQFVPKEIKKEREIDPLDPYIPFLKHNGENLVNVLFATRDLRPAAYELIINDFKEIYPDVTGLTFTHLGDSRYALEFNRKILNKNWSFLSPQISDGFVITLAILTLIHMQWSNKIVLIEEIENGLNPFTLGKIFQKILLISESKGIQFFITSHSPVLLDLLNKFPELIFVCEQHDGYSEYIPLPEILKIFRNDYKVGDSLVELWLEGLIGGL